MLIPLLFVVAFYASEPFPIDPGANADLWRLREAWQAPATTGEERGEMFARINAAAATPHPDWRAVADGYFAWRNAGAAARDAQHAIFTVQQERVQAEIAARPVVCTTRTHTEKGLYGDSYSTSKTTCEK